MEDEKLVELLELSIDLWKGKVAEARFHKAKIEAMGLSDRGYWADRLSECEQSVELSERELELVLRGLDLEADDV